MEGGTNNGKPDRAQLTDFTTVFRLNKDDPHATRINDRSGTMCFWAPEMFTEQCFEPSALDVWAFGCSIYSMLFGRLPFDSSNQEVCKNSILNDDPQLEFDDIPVSDEIKNLLKSLLVKDPTKRPTMK